MTEEPRTTTQEEEERQVAPVPHPRDVALFENGVLTVDPRELAKTMVLRIRAFEKIQKQLRGTAVRATRYPGNWMRFGEKFRPRHEAAEAILSIMGGALVDLTIDYEDDVDEIGKIRRYYADAWFVNRITGTRLPVQGYADTRDQFLAADKSLSPAEKKERREKKLGPKLLPYHLVSRGNIRKKARTQLVVNAAILAASIRDVSGVELGKWGIPSDQIPSADFKNNAPQANEAERRTLLAELSYYWEQLGPEGVDLSEKFSGTDLSTIRAKWKSEKQVTWIRDVIKRIRGHKGFAHVVADWHAIKKTGGA